MINSHLQTNAKMCEYHKKPLPWILAILCFLSCAVNATQQVLDCGGNFTAATGTLQSPGYPGNYTNNLDCVYVITRPQGERITLTFERLDIAGGDECTADVLEIRDGDSANSPVLARVCDTSLPSPKRTFQNHMWIRLRSDGAVTGTGFRTSYTSGSVKEDFFLITSSKGRIYQMDVETGANRVLPLPVLYNPIAVDYDPVEERLYWTDVIIRQILSAYINGSDIRSLRVFNASAVLDGLAIDPLSRLVFYTDAGNDVIAMMGLSGASHKTIISTDLDNPRAIVLDTMNGVMFWTDWGKPAKIERAKYDGTDRRTLHGYALSAPNALAVDLHNNRLYWADAGYDVIEFSDLDGNSRTRLYTVRGEFHFFGMTYYDNMLYVTDWTGLGSSTNISYLHKMSTNGSMGKTFGSVPGRLNDIHIYVEYGWQRGPNSCGYNNGGCSHICIPASGNSSKCLCPDTPTVCLEVSGASTTTRPVTSTPSTTSTTSTSTPSPTTVNIQGPSLFDTDGSKEMTLTCDPENRKGVRFVTWSVTCAIQDDRKCVWTPRPPGDDGTVVTCSITYIDGQSGVGSFRLQLNYPPSAPPVIHGYKTGDAVQAGDSLTMTCLVRDGKPLVTSVIFSCPGHPDNVRDIRGDSEVQSLVVINPLRASDNGVRCVCTAEWKRSEWYALSATRVLNVEGTNSLPAEADQLSTGYIVGGAVGGGAFLIVVVVIIVVVICRRGGRKYESRVSDNPAPDVELNPYARLGQPGFLGNPCPTGLPAAAKDEDTANSIYAEIVEEQCKGEKPAKSDYDSVRPPLPSARPPQENYERLYGKKPVSKPTHPSEPADDYLHPAKSDSDYLHPATPADDYLHPVKPRAEPDSNYLHPANTVDDYLHPVKPRAPDSDYLHPATPAEDYLHPVKPGAKADSDYFHTATPADDYLHPIKPGAEPDSDYLHPATPADDYLHPVKPGPKPDSEYIHPVQSADIYLHSATSVADYLHPRKPVQTGQGLYPR